MYIKIPQKKNGTHGHSCIASSILKDETYIGNTVHYKQTNISFKNGKRIRKSQKMNGGE